MSRSDGMTQVIFGDSNLTLGLVFTEGDLAEEVAEACKWAAKNLDKGKMTSAVAEQVNVVKERIKELEEILDPLRLRPLILGTNCNLCPA
jgi:hypothetical protein